MATVVDALLITMGLDGSGVSKGMDQVESRIKQGVASIVTNIMAPLAGAFAFKSLVDSYTSTAAALDNLSKSLGVGMADLDAWGQAAARSGGSVEGFRSTLSMLNRKVQQTLEFGGDGKKIFDSFGISLKGAGGNAKPTIQILEELAKKADTMDKAKFAGMAKKLGLDQGTIQLLQSGSKEVDVLVTKMKALSYTEEDAKVASEFNNSIDDLKKTFMSAASPVLRIFLPAITALTLKLQTFVAFIRKHETFVASMFLAAAAVLTTLFLPALGAVATAAWAAIAPFLPFIALVAVLALLIDDLWTYIDGGESALQGLWEQFGTGKEIAAALGDAWEMLKVIGIGLFDALIRVTRNFFSSFKGILGPIVGIFKSIVAIARALFAGDFAAVFTGVVDLIKNQFDLLVEMIKGALNFIMYIANTLFDGLGDSIAGAFTSIIDGVANGIKGLISKIPKFLLPEGLSTWASEIDSTVSDAAKNIAVVAPSVMTTSSAESSGASAAGNTSIDNSSETVVNAAITVNSQDPATAGTSVKTELNKMANAGNKGVRQ